jgi:hypothetical protein
MIVEIVKSFSKYNAGEKFNFTDSDANALIDRGLVKVYAAPAKAAEIDQDLKAKKPSKKESL